MTQPKQENTREIEWSYDPKAGPDRWGDLSPSFQMCSLGNEQSPIDLVPGDASPAPRTKTIQLGYRSTPFTFGHNGHSIQAEPLQHNNVLTVDEQSFPLVQFHFHTPSEHTFNGKHHDIELHLVHQNQERKIVVVAVMIKEGTENEELKEMWLQLPKEKTTENISLQRAIDISCLVPETRTSYLYTGSLTTPPCSEGVDWIVFQETITMSQKQILCFRDIFSDNHRSVQKLGRRKILVADASHYRLQTKRRAEKC